MCTDMLRSSAIAALATVLLLVGLISLQGCGMSGEAISTTYEASSDRSTYETRPVRITRRGSGLGTSGQQVLYVKAQAVCEGAECTPEEVRLLVASGTRNVTWLDYDNVSIVSDNWSHTWRNVSKREDPELVGVGEFMRFNMSLDDYREMLKTRSLTIQIGSMDVGLSFNQLARFRELMAAMSGDVDAPEEVL